MVRAGGGGQDDHGPGLIIDPDPSNEEILAALGGGLSWAKPSATDPAPDTYMKDGENDHVYEALFYAVVGIMPVQKIEERVSPLVMKDRRPQVEEQQGLGFHEGKGDQWA